jgi:hypothetical protein
LTSAAYTVGAKERSEPETDYTFQSLFASTGQHKIMNFMVKPFLYVASCA